MSGHRKFLILLGMLQLAFAAGYIGLEPARGVALEQRASYGAAYEIIEELEDRGALVATANFDASRDRENIISQAVRERLIRARESRHFLAGTIAVFGGIALLVGFIPDRRRTVPPAEG